jgi:SSS family solute:Na+ symporter
LLKYSIMAWQNAGSGYKIGMAIAVYELMAAATLVIVAIFFMPVYLENRICTMPQFLEQRILRLN